MISINHIKDIAGKYFRDKPVVSVFLFGSYARGEADENSDIDLLVNYDGSKKISFFDVIRFKIGLEKLLNKKVELVEEDLMYEGFRKNVAEEKIKIYEA